ncbi:MAG: ATP-binding cassette domain-containing protein [Rhodothermaceae bacterium]|nr:ATP-binding cassette domain-containing protein [Rhodothermaceae bacterium]
MIHLHRVTKSYGATQALRAVSLEVAAGQTTVLLGPSGCGKSTLLRLVAGLIVPDEGNIRVEGTLITPATAPALRQRMGYVIQEGGLFPHLTARENVILMARHLGWPDGRIAQRLADLADLTALPLDMLDRYPVQLSGGQRQRVALMRALFLDPAVLLLDEPLGALDPMIRSDLQDDLRAIIRRLGKTALLVTHDLSEAGFFGDTVVLLRDGAIVQQGSFRDLVERPAEPFVERFVQAQRSLVLE